MPKELGFQQRLRNGSAIDRDKRPRLPMAEGMDRLRRELLPRPRLSRDQNRQIRLCHLAHLIEDHPHCRARPDHLRTSIHGPLPPRVHEQFS